MRPMRRSSPNRVSSSRAGLGFGKRSSVLHVETERRRDDRDLHPDTGRSTSTERYGCVIVDETAQTSSDIPSTVPVTVGSMEWRLEIARLAWKFFAMEHDPEIAKLIEPLVNPDGRPRLWNFLDFSHYLYKIGFPQRGAEEITRILGAMERAGLLMHGWDPTGVGLLGDIYVSIGVDSMQTRGNLWLSEVFGAELIIDSYSAVTVQISGGEGGPGTGLVLDSSHVVTNKHVTKGFQGRDIEIHSRAQATGEEGVAARLKRVHPHRELDVAVIEVQPPDNGYFRALPGMVFRDPVWADEIYLLGYPRVPWMVGTDIAIQRGEVVNPLIEAPPVRDDDTEALGIIPAAQRRSSTPQSRDQVTAAVRSLRTMAASSASWSNLPSHHSRPTLAAPPTQCRTKMTRPPPHRSIAGFPQAK